jgi:stearoyl-CoA desaturase (delta-9 desaturase)
MILWKETFWNSFFVAGMLRYAFLLNMTWLVNSAAHMWGNRPYDNNISAAENMLVIVGSFGEGYHNYHHTFPWDYATSEIGWTINGSKFFIDVCSWLGFAYDLKRADPDVVLSRRKRTGDLRVELRANKDQHDS